MKSKVKLKSSAVVLIAACAMSVTNVVQAQVTLWQDNDPQTPGLSGIGNNLTVSQVSNTTGSGTPGLIGAVDESTTTGAFASIITPNPIDLSAYAGANFTMSFDWFVPSTTSATANDLFYTQVNYNGANSGSAGFINELAESGSGWNNFLWNTGPVIPAGVTNAQFFIIHVDGGFSGPRTLTPGTLMYLDNIMVTVPEPTTFALLGLGAAAMLIRRRMKS